MLDTIIMYAFELLSAHFNLIMLICILPLKCDKIQLDTITVYMFLSC